MPLGKGRAGSAASCLPGMDIIVSVCDFEEGALVGVSTTWQGSSCRLGKLQVFFLFPLSPTSDLILITLFVFAHVAAAAAMFVDPYDLVWLPNELPYGTDPDVPAAAHMSDMHPNVHTT